MIDQKLVKEFEFILNNNIEVHDEDNFKQYSGRFFYKYTKAVVLFLE